MFLRIFEADQKKNVKKKGFGIKFGWSYFYWFENYWNKVYYHSEPVCYFWVNISFAVCVSHVHMNTLNYALIFYAVMDIS